MGRNWSKQLKSCCNLGFYENQSEVDIQGWYSISPLMCDISQGKQWTPELAKQDPEGERVGSWDEPLLSRWRYARFPILLSDTVFQNWPENLSCFAWILQKKVKVLHEYYKKKWKQLILSLVFCQICHIKFCKLYTILSVHWPWYLPWRPSLLPVSCLFQVSPLIRGDAEGVEPGLHIVFISLHKTLWKSWRGSGQRGRKWAAHQTGSTDTFKKPYRINKVLACF